MGPIREFESSSKGIDWSAPLVRAITAAVGVALVATSAALLLIQPAPSTLPEVPASEVLSLAAAGEVAQVSMPPSALFATATLAEASDGAPARQVQFAVPESARPAVTEALFARGVEVDFSPVPVQWHLAAPFASSGQGPARPVWLVFVAMQVALGGVCLMVFAAIATPARLGAKSASVPSHVPVTEAPLTRFSDVQGADEAVQQVSEMSDYLANPEKYTRLGAKLPRGCLLVGPPGTGKTLLARALAGECGVPVFAANGSDFVEIFVGTGARRIRDLYQQAREAGKAVVFIDEVDAIARKRTEHATVSGAHESENTLLALLSELDGFEEGSSVITIAATNRPDVLDPALTRPGRLDRRVEVPLPDRRGREAILRRHSSAVTLDEAVDLEYVARNAPGFSGAQLQLVVNEAALHAAHRDAHAVCMADFAAAISTVAMGRPRHSALVTESDRRVTAWHEAGHAVCALLLDHADDPVAVTIVPRGQAGGLTWMEGSDDHFLTRSRAWCRMVVALGGRCAEEQILGGDFTQGAVGDLSQATETAWSMVSQFGMTRAGLASRGGGLTGQGSDADREVVEEMLRDARRQALQLLDDHSDLLESVALALLDEESLSRARLVEIAATFRVEPSSVPVEVEEYALADDSR